MAKVRISKSKLKQIIKEEYSRKVTEIKLKNRLRQINEEISEITEEEDMGGELEEVRAGNQEKVRATGWTGKKGGDEKWSTKFEKKGSHLVEEDEELEINLDSASDDMSDDMSGDEELDFDAIFAQLTSAIENKIEQTVDEKIGGGDSDEELEIDIPEDGMDEIPEDETDEVPEEETEEVPGDETIDEQDGESIAQKQSPKNAVPFDNNAAKIPTSSERDKGSIVSESTKKRMQILSGVRRNDFHDNQ